MAQFHHFLLVVCSIVYSFLRHLASNNGVPLKSGLGVMEGIEYGTTR